MFNQIEDLFIDSNEKYIVLKNGIIIQGNGIFSLEIKESGTYKIVHIVEEDINININIANSIEVCLKEIFFKIENNPKITINLTVGDNTRIDYLSFKQNNKSDKICFLANTYLGEKAYINLKNLSILNSKVNLTDNVYLDKKNATIDMKNVIINASGKNQVYQYDIYHQAVKTRSEMHNFAISKNKSHIDIKSKGIIFNKSYGADLLQKTKGLIMDMYSQIAADPILIINENDCLASHGASIGEINEEELYYVMSRGLPRNESEKLIISGFINPFFIEMSEDKAVDFMKEMIIKNI